ncbi:MAG TPA: PLP-dependent transferase [Thermoanaerobaculia bacterium]|nr:PLP-dependent transferase [Thermoanaerobaculia bacterium]
MMTMNQGTAAPLSIHDLEEVLRRILGQEHALPEDWEALATTYDLPRFHSEAEFLARFQAAARQMLAQEIHDPPRLRALLADCGHPYDYARLGHPLSTVYELYLRNLTGAGRVVSFASRTKAFLAPIEARRMEPSPVRLYAAGRLPLSAAKQAALRAQQVEIHENWTGPLPEAARGTLTIYVSDAPPAKDTLEQVQADAVSCSVDEGGVLLIRQGAALDPQKIQLIRKRTVAALLAANAKTELQLLILLPGIFPGMRASTCFCTGLAAEAAVFSATAKVLSENAGQASVTLFYAANCYGGTHQLIDEILRQDGLITPKPLAVLDPNAAQEGREVTLVDRVIEALPELSGGPACLFLETPTNPELQVHDFARLMRALWKYRTDTGHPIAVLVDTTMAPLYPLFTKDFAQDWPFLIVKSGSKYLTKGKATLGLALCADNALAKKILDEARDYGRDADSFAKSSQLRALAEGLVDLGPRMARIAENTRRLARRIKEELEKRGHDDVTLHSMSDEDLAGGLASGILSFYLPPAPTRHPDLVDEFVEYLLTHAPELVKNRVSYGQSSDDGRRDYFYVINPEESTQGSLPEAVKAAQKKDDVQICRISVPALADVEGLVEAMNSFFDLKYGLPPGG